MIVYRVTVKGATNTGIDGGRRGAFVNNCVVLFRRAAET